MKKIVILFIFLIFVKFSFSQEIKKKIIVKNERQTLLVVGFHSSYFSLKNRDTVTWKWNYLYYYEIEPHISYYPIPNLGLGACFGYSKYYSNFMQLDNLRWYGIYTRYTIPFHINVKYLNRINLYAEINYQRTNYIQFKREMDPIVSDKIEYNLLTIPLGFQIRLWKGLFYEGTYVFNFFFNDKVLLWSRIGFDYYFYKPPKQKMEE